MVSLPSAARLATAVRTIAAAGAAPRRTDRHGAGPRTSPSAGPGADVGGVSPVCPGADVAAAGSNQSRRGCGSGGVQPVPAQMWAGWAQSWRGRSPGADVGSSKPTPQL